jgi:hypothetical protein
LRNLPNKVLAPNICAICNDPLMVLGEGGVLRPREKTVTLTCGHPYTTLSLSLVVNVVLSVVYRCISL